MSERLQRLWRWARRKLLVLGALLVVLFSIVGLLYAVTAARFGRAMAQRREQGLPTMLAELTPTMPPPERNAAIPYLQAVDLCCETEDSPTVAPVFRQILDIYDETGGQGGGDNTPEQRAQLRLLLADPAAQNLLQLLGDAGRRPDCVFDLDYAAGPRTTVPQYAPLRAFSWLLCEAAGVAAEDGDAERATQLLLAALGLVRHERREPFVLLQLTAVWLGRDTIEAVNDATARVLLDGGQLERLQRALAMPVERDIVLAAWDRETLSMVAYYLELDAAMALREMGGMTAEQTFLYRLPLGLGRQWDLAYMVQVCGPVREALAVPYFEAAGARGSLDVAVAKLPDYAYAAPRMATVGRKYAARLTGGDAALVAAATDCALRRWRLDHDSVPATLDLLVPDYLDAIPIDPITGQPFTYIRTDTGWELPFTAPSPWPPSPCRTGP